MMSKREQLQLQYETLAHKEGEFTEIRLLPSAKSFFCTNKEQFVETALPLLEEGKENVYVGINPRATNSPGTVSSIPRLTTIVIDIDPVRPKDAPSSDEQHVGAIELANRIRKDFGRGTVVSSGSGAHLYLPIQPLEVKDARLLSESLKKYYDAIKEKYENEKYKFDHIWDLPRIIRCWGSTNLKSKRVCSPVSVVDTTRAASVFNQEPKQKEIVIETTDELTQKFQRLCKTNKRLRDLTQGGIAFESKSEADFAFVSILSKAQFSIGEIKALWEYNTSGNPEPKKNDVERMYDKLSPDRDSKAFSLANNHKDYYMGISSRRMGIRSGFNTLDEMISGFKEGKIYIFGARPGTGKTTLATQILTNMAEQGIPCLFFPTEVGAEPIIDKIISRKCSIELKKFQNGTFKDKDVYNIEQTRDYISNLPLTIYEDFGLDIDKYEQEIDKYAPKVVCLDYFQALKWKDAASVGEKEDAVRRIKKLTKDRNIITICLSQLNRTNTGKVGMSELKGTGALEEYADVIGQAYKSDKVDVYPVPVDLIITKSKYSATGNIPLDFDVTHAHFKENEVTTRVSV